MKTIAALHAILRTTLFSVWLSVPRLILAADFPDGLEMTMLQIGPEPGKAGPISWMLAANPSSIMVDPGMVKTPLGGPYRSQEAVNADYEKLGLVSIGLGTGDDDIALYESQAGKLPDAYKEALRKDRQQGHLPVLVRCYDAAGQRLIGWDTLVRSYEGKAVHGSFVSDEKLDRGFFGGLNLPGAPWTLPQHEGPPWDGREHETPAGPLSPDGGVDLSRDGKSLTLTPSNGKSIGLQPGDRVSNNEHSHVELQSSFARIRVAALSDVAMANSAGRLNQKSGSLDIETANQSSKSKTSVEIESTVALGVSEEDDSHPGTSSPAPSASSAGSGRDASGAPSRFTTPAESLQPGDHSKPTLPRPTTASQPAAPPQTLSPASHGIDATTPGVYSIPSERLTSSSHPPTSIAQNPSSTNVPHPATPAADNPASSIAHDPTAGHISPSGQVTPSKEPMSPGEHIPHSLPNRDGAGQSGAASNKKPTARDSEGALQMSVGTRPVDMDLDVDKDGRVMSADARLILQGATDVMRRPGT